MTLDEAVKDVERSYAPHALKQDDPNPAGIEFVTIVSGAIKAEGAVFPLLCDTEARAIDLWRREVMSYGLGKMGAPLYWRDKPAMRSFQMTMAEMIGKTQTQRLVTTRYAVSSRLAIGERP